MSQFSNNIAQARGATSMYHPAVEYEEQPAAFGPSAQPVTTFAAQPPTSNNHSFASLTNIPLRSGIVDAGSSVSTSNINGGGYGVTPSTQSSAHPVVDISAEWSLRNMQEDASRRGMKDSERSQEDAYREGLKEGERTRDKAYKEGLKKGEKSREEAYKQGLKEGEQSLNEAYAKGLAKGYSDGEKKSKEEAYGRGFSDGYQKCIDVMREPQYDHRRNASGVDRTMPRFSNPPPAPHGIFPMAVATGQSALQQSHSHVRSQDSPTRRRPDEQGGCAVQLSAPARPSLANQMVYASETQSSGRSAIPATASAVPALANAMTSSHFVGAHAYAQVPDVSQQIPWDTYPTQVQHGA